LADLEQASPTWRQWVGQSIRRAGWVPFVFFAIHLVASKGFEAYEHVPWLDIPMHFFGGVAMAYFLAASLDDSAAPTVLGELNPFGNFLLALSAVGAITGIWEFAEWTTDSLGWTSAQLGLDDTLLDMFLGMAGGLLYLLFWCQRKGA
jgi:hypothetical protein